MDSSIGFNVTPRTHPGTSITQPVAFTTAGHCVLSLPQTAYGNSESFFYLRSFGSITDANYPIADNALGTYSYDPNDFEDPIIRRRIIGWWSPGSVGIYDGNGGAIKVEGETEAIIGATICKSGYRTDRIYMWNSTGEKCFTKL